MQLVDDSPADEAFLLELLNTTPIVDRAQRDTLDGEPGRAWLRERGGDGSAAEQGATRAARDALQAITRGDEGAQSLAPLLSDVRLAPLIEDEGISWSLTDVPPARALAVRALLAWDAVRRTGPGRLRPCANDECALFLIDHSKPNRARWCSMATCGNRMKARRHHERTRAEASAAESGG
ncbi:MULTISPECIES: CGNR zinc finger domain-containing protein [unclassified Modestobacter]|uniref:CGNR zinc finger domain-containing protein n=1 Tax=unclassified Modestobacter TaxID=2643866 RepID=UPI0022AAEE8F|nr:MULTISPECIES: CGNR zinc finger domain-containing protein [unclassified Modestobacter]MCZ2822796.1 CGNR zinc finger domain-containing protein [Modestobacter sp. VKM Ac-2981]MCZ2851042.1 CGNR zinc finger domain-containing protein [Modestobacter sp. VKM Ac-2982]